MKYVQAVFNRLKKQDAELYESHPMDMYRDALLDSLDLFEENLPGEVRDLLTAEMSDADTWINEALEHVSSRVTGFALYSTGQLPRWFEDSNIEWLDYEDVSTPSLIEVAEHVGGNDSLSLNTHLDAGFNIEEQSIFTTSQPLVSDEGREDIGGKYSISLNTHSEVDSNIESAKNFENVFVPGQQTLRTFVDYQTDPYRPVTETAQQMCRDIMDELKNDPRNKHVIRWEDAGGGIKVIRSNLFKDKPERKGDEIMLAKIEAWAKWKYPSNWEEVYSEAIVKYAKLKKDHPEYHQNQIMVALKRHAISENRKAKAAKRVELVLVGDEMEERTSCDSYPYEQQEWWDSLTDNNRKGFMELSDHLEKTDDDWSSIPESIKRKVRKVEARVPEHIDPKEAQTSLTGARNVIDTDAEDIAMERKSRFRIQANYMQEVS